MVKRLVIVCAVWLAVVSARAEDAPKPADLETRKRQLASLQKDLEASRPEPGAPPEQNLAYLEIAIDSYGQFVKDNPKTAEGFEAGSTLAIMLAQARHPKASEYAKLAAEGAPKAGVDVKRVGLCWAIVADGCLGKKDMAGARAAIENVKSVDPQMYKQMMDQLQKAEEQFKGK